MNGFLEDLACGAIGYGIAKLGGNKEPASSTEHYNWPIYSVIADWANHNGIYGRNNSFYRELLNIAEKYRDPFND